MTKNTLTKEILRAYLLENLADLSVKMTVNDIQFKDHSHVSTIFNKAIEESIQKAERLTHVRISKAFQYVAECREYYGLIMERRQREERRQAELEEQRREEERREAAIEGLPIITINTEYVLDRVTLPDGEDVAQINRQLNDAPLFKSLSYRDIYMKRHALNYAMTGGADAVIMQAVAFSDYIERFLAAIRFNVDIVWHSDIWVETGKRYSIRSFFYNKEAIIEGLTNNKIADYYMMELGARSPKYSKYLVQMFGEKSDVVKMFNDRPTAGELTKTSIEVVEDSRVVLSNLACNVMKMTAGNSFSSCQDYEQSDSDALGNLSCLPSSVNDENMSIAYECEIGESILFPHMTGRLLIKPIEYHGKIFFLGFNGYGNTKNIRSTLRAVYGDRFINENDFYSGGDKFEYTHEYNYDLRVEVEHEQDCTCYMCDGSGDVTATVNHYGYEFTAECPICEGSGEHESNESESYYEYPYINGSNVDYKYGNTCEISLPESMIIEALDKEIEAQEQEIAA